MMVKIMHAFEWIPNGYFYQHHILYVLHALHLSVHNLKTRCKPTHQVFILVLKSKYKLDVLTNEVQIIYSPSNSIRFCPEEGVCFDNAILLE